MPAEFQAKLLRILETRPSNVSATIALPVDVRLIAATNVDLDDAVADGRFREDLFYRLAVVEIRLPALAEQPRDVPLLIEHFAASSAKARAGRTSRRARSNISRARHGRATSANSATSSRAPPRSTPAERSTTRWRRFCSTASGGRSTTG